MVLFLIFFLLSGCRVEFALGLIAPNDNLGSFGAVVAWAASFMFWQIIINFCYPLQPLTGLELLKHSAGRYLSARSLAVVAWVVAAPLTAVFLWQGAKYFCLLQIWIGLWGLPRLMIGLS